MLSVQKSPSEKTCLGFIESISVPETHSTNLVPSSVMFHLVYFWFVSFVAFVKFFLEHLGIITCDDSYVCYTALIALKAVILVFGIWIVVVPSI